MKHDDFGDNARPSVWGVDADIVLYSVGWATKNESVKEAIKTTKIKCNNIATQVEASETILYLTGKSNYRNEYGCDLFPYKGQRSKDKPTHFQEIRQYLIEELGAIVIEGQEADDQLGIDCCTKGHGIATIDKDLWGVPGWHYNWNKSKMDFVSEVQANRFFYTQLITGDSTDNIPGIFKRTGIKATKDLKDPIENLTTPEELYKHVKQIYLDASKGSEEVDDWLLRQGRQLWIRRKENELWEPPIL